MTRRLYCKPVRLRAARALLLWAALLSCAASRAAAPALNVVQLGADPTGRKDSTAVLQRAHATGRRIYYPNGVYRFNGRTLDLSGGVTFESPRGVTIRNDLSPENILQFDDAGRLIGLMQNHLEENEKTLGGPLPIRSGSLVRPPIAQAPGPVRIDVLAHWYNDFGLEHRRVYAARRWGWIGWYYWSWNFHRAGGDGYDPARHPLLGFYRGDDPVVLDWQCCWLRRYGVKGVILYMPSPKNLAFPFGLDGWERPEHLNHWIYHLFTDVPNFRGLKYVMTAYAPWTKNASAAVRRRVEAEWMKLIERIYLRRGDFYAIEAKAGRYPVIYVHEEGAVRGVFDNYRGGRNTAAFYTRVARRFQRAGLAGVAIFARHPISGRHIDFARLEKQGVLHYAASYAKDYSSGRTYAERVRNYRPPVGPRIILNVCTARQSHTPHPSRWRCPGHSPALFKAFLAKAAAHVLAHNMPRVITCYNVAEWAEGGPGLQPNVKDRFGYLEAVRDVVLTDPPRGEEDAP